MTGTVRMPRRRLRETRTGLSGFFDAAQSGRTFSGGTGQFSVLADDTRMPEGHMTRINGKLQDAATELEALLFEVPGLHPACRDEVHDSLGLVMEALQMLGRARRSLERAPVPAIDPRLTSSFPMLRA